MWSNEYCLESNDRKTSSLKQNSGRKQKLFDRDRRTLIRTVRKDYKNTAPKMTSELNDDLKNPLFNKNCKTEAAQSRISREGCNQKTILKIFVWNVFLFPLFFPTPIYIYIYIYIYAPLPLWG